MLRVLFFSVRTYKIIWFLCFEITRRPFLNIYFPLAFIILRVRYADFGKKEKKMSGDVKLGITLRKIRK